MYSVSRTASRSTMINRCCRRESYYPALTSSATVRNHMNHGGGGQSAGPPPQSGPRASNVDLGLEATKHTGNILRLLESSHGAYFYNTYDTLSTVWHVQSQSWRQESADGNWTCVNPIEALAAEESHRHKPSTPKLCSMSFSDHRTALVKMIGQDSKLRYLQLLRLDGDVGDSMAAGGMSPNDGWILTQEVVIGQSQEDCSTSTARTDLHAAILTYFDIEHGGGSESLKKSKKLFHPNSKLMSVGIDDIEAAPTQWTAPVGSLVEVPLGAYLEGVQSQTPHAQSAKTQDMIINIDHITGCSAAAATVRVGNGAQTSVFEDHLLFGKTKEDDWQILSKTFSSQAW